MTIRRRAVLLLSNPRWEALINAQAKAFTVAQAGQHGITHHHIRAQVVSGRWQRVHPRVYVAYNGPLTEESRLWAAVLYAGPDTAVLCLRTAGHAWGLVAAPPSTIDVLVEGLSRLVAADDVRVHRTRRSIPPGDIHRSAAPPRTTIERTVLDLAEQLDEADDVCELVAKAIRGQLTTGPRLVAALERRSHARHRRLLGEIIRLAEDGAHSVLEIRFVQLVRRHGLPEPRRQIWHRDGDRSYRFDALYEQFELAVELDGRLVHTAVGQWEAGLERDNIIQNSGLDTQHFSGRQVLGGPCRVARQLATALEARGWAGVYRPCPDCP
ncbi:hypothetical protein [Pseudofrankia saprophytica]|uniref:hypothetical protein n=1 Tax=Pseudofrankia saprophytica TaxID=298655 RepID=UPI0006871B3E|nr:hypothetical protein [Pseudofrankia saprophytica]